MIKPGNEKFLSLFVFLRAARPGSEVSFSYRVGRQGLGTKCFWTYVGGRMYCGVEGVRTRLIKDMKAYVTYE